MSGLEKGLTLCCQQNRPLDTPLIKELSIMVVKRPTFDETYMEVVDIIARRSTCLRKKVGAVIVVDRRIIAHGYNGVVSGEEHCCDIGVCRKDLAGREDYKPCVHAEQNALCVCAKRGLAVQGGTLYVNADICLTCAKLIVSCALSRVVIRRDYKGTEEGIGFLLQHGLQVDFWLTCRRTEGTK